MESNKASTKKPGRRHDVDWLRVIATFSIFIFHCLRFFDPTPWEVKNNVTSDFVFIFIGFFGQWIIPLFFIISGAAIYFTLGFRDRREFVMSRFSRIMVPYLFIGIFVLVPPQDYIKVVKGGLVPRLAGISFVEFYPEYVTHIRPFYGEFPFVALPMMHLWYLFYLFIFSLVMLPVFLYLRSEQGRSHISRFASSFEKPGAIFLFAFPIGLLTTFLDPSSSIGDIFAFGGWSLLVYPILLFYGFLIFSDKRLQSAIDRHATLALILAFVTFPIFFSPLVKALMGEGFFFGTLEYAGLMVLRAFNMWFFVVAFLGVGRRYLNFSNRVLRYTSEGSLPFYMLHQTVIVGVGFFIAGWQMAIPYKFIFLFVVSLTGIMLIYELPIRRVNTVRVLFGLKPKKV